MPIGICFGNSSRDSFSNSSGSNFRIRQDFFSQKFLQRFFGNWIRDFSGNLYRESFKNLFTNFLRVPLVNSPRIFSGISLFSQQLQLKFLSEIALGIHFKNGPRDSVQELVLGLLTGFSLGFLLEFLHDFLWNIFEDSFRNSSWNYFWISTWIFYKDSSRDRLRNSNRKFNCFTGYSFRIFFRRFTKECLRKFHQEFLQGFFKECLSNSSGGYFRNSSSIFTEIYSGAPPEIF